MYKIKATSTHKSAKTHAGSVFMTRNLDLWPFDPKINAFSGVIVERFCVKFGDPSCIGFLGVRVDCSKAVCRPSPTWSSSWAQLDHRSRTRPAGARTAVTTSCSSLTMTFHRRSSTNEITPRTPTYHIAITTSSTSSSSSSSSSHAITGGIGGVVVGEHGGATPP